MEGEVSQARQWISHWYPQCIRKGSSAHHPHLELCLYKGRIQLGTQDALYSDGDQYWPALAAADFWETQDKPLNKVTVLGAGLGSLVHILESRGHQPNYILVDYDPLILEWAREFYPPSALGRTEFIEAEAMEYLGSLASPGSQSLVFVDLFSGVEAWPGVQNRDFLERVRDLLEPGGGIALNYLVLDPHRWDGLLETAYGVFAGLGYESHDRNRLLWARV